MTVNPMKIRHLTADVPRSMGAPAEKVQVFPPHAVQCREIQSLGAALGTVDEGDSDLRAGEGVHDAGLHGTTTQLAHVCCATDPGPAVRP